MRVFDWIKDHKTNTLISLIIGVGIYILGEKNANNLDSFTLFLISFFSALIWHTASLLWSSLNKIHSVLSSRNIILNLLTEVLEKEGGLSKKGVKQLLSHGNYTIKKSRVPKAWLSLSWGIKEHYLSVNYARPSDAYQNENIRNTWSNTGIEIQNLKSTSGQVDSIKKIYILDEEKELTCMPLKEVLLQHIASKVEVYYILKSDIDNNHELSEAAKKIPSLDFSIVDKEYVFIWNLDCDRDIESAEMRFSDFSLESHGVFFNILYRESYLLGSKALYDIELKYTDQATFCEIK